MKHRFKKEPLRGAVAFEPGKFIDLKSPSVAAEYLSAAIEDMTDIDEAFEVFFSALGEIVKAQGVQDVADKMEMGRDSLYKIFRTHQNPTVKTLSKLLAAVDMQLSVTPIVRVTATKKRA